MPSVARYIPLRALAVNVIAIYSRSRRKRRKPVSMTTVEPLVKPLYSPDELAELRRTMLRYARSFPPGDERNQHLQIVVSLRKLFKNERWLDAHTIKDRSQLQCWQAAAPSRAGAWAGQCSLAATARPNFVLSVKRSQRRHRRAERLYAGFQ